MLLHAWHSLSLRGKPDVRTWLVAGLTYVVLDFKVVPLRGHMSYDPGWMASVVQLCLALSILRLYCLVDHGTQLRLLGNKIPCQNT